MTEESPFTRNHEQRSTDAAKLLEDFNLRQDAEFFADPANRLEFISGLSTEEFIDLVEHVNARMRSQDPRERLNAHDVGAALPMLGTPEPDEKEDALKAGYNVIHDYLINNDDSVERKLEGAGMAVEALIIWVHPFNDGNGRTSRFFGKFIESGTTNLDELQAETANINNRLRMYDKSLRVDTWNTVKNQDIIWDDGELEEIEAKTKMPVADGIALSIKRILELDAARDRIHLHQARLKGRAR